MACMRLPLALALVLCLAFTATVADSKQTRVITKKDLQITYSQIEELAFRDPEKAEVLVRALADQVAEKPDNFEMAEKDIARYVARSTDRRTASRDTVDISSRTFPNLESMTMSDSDVTQTVISEKLRGIGGEPQIAINPVDPRYIIATAMRFVAGNRHIQVLQYSHDGGATWTEVIHPMDQDEVGTRTTGNGVLGWSVDGIIAFLIEPGCETTQGCTNHEGWILRSFDFGETWSDRTIIQNTLDFTEPYLYVAPVGDMYVCFESKLVMFFMKSSDNGNTWTSPMLLHSDPDFNITNLDDPWRGSGCAITVDDSDNVYVFWHSTLQQISVTVSTDRGDTFQEIVADSDPIKVTDTNVYYDFPIPIMDERRVFTYCSVGTDFENDIIYVAFTDHFDANDDGKDTAYIRIFSTDNGGDTWTELSSINDDPNNDIVDFFYPSLKVDSEGRVHVAFYSTQNSNYAKRDIEKRHRDVLDYVYRYYSGGSWSKWFRVSSMSSPYIAPQYDPQDFYAYLARFQFYDNTAMDLQFNTVAFAWSDNREETGVKLAVLTLNQVFSTNPNPIIDCSGLLFDGFSTDATHYFEGETASLAASITGGTSPYTFKFFLGEASSTPICSVVSTTETSGTCVVTISQADADEHNQIKLSVVVQDDAGCVVSSNPIIVTVIAPTFELSSTIRPFCSLDEDGYIDQGELNALVITLENVGTAEALGVTASITAERYYPSSDSWKIVTLPFLPKDEVAVPLLFNAISELPDIDIDEYAIATILFRVGSRVPCTTRFRFRATLTYTVPGDIERTLDLGVISSFEVGVPAKVPLYESSFEDPDAFCREWILPVKYDYVVYPEVWRIDFCNDKASRPAGGSGGFAVCDSDAAGAGSKTWSSLQSLSINLGSVRAGMSVLLEYDYFFRTTTYPSNEYALVEVRDKTGSWVEVARYAGADQDDHATIDITTYAQGNVDFALRFTLANATWDWWFAIDNVLLYRHYDGKGCKDNLGTKACLDATDDETAAVCGSVDVGKQLRSLACESCDHFEGHDDDDDDDDDDDGDHDDDDDDDDHHHHGLDGISFNLYLNFDNMFPGLPLPAGN